MPFRYNWYFNVVKPMLDGWCMFLDDDDELRSEPKNPGSDTNKMFLYKVNIAGRVVPNDQNFGGKPVLNDISGLSVVFHSSEMVDWRPQRGGDYDFISEMHAKCYVVWVNRILSATQTGGNNGNRKDLD